LKRSINLHAARIACNITQDHFPYACLLYLCAEPTLFSAEQPPWLLWNCPQVLQNIGLSLDTKDINSTHVEAGMQHL